jgi:hypothetical protein
LAGVYAQQGQYAEAESLSQEALAIRKEILGTRHPDYLQSLDNLAKLYDAMGEVKEGK